MDRHHVGALTTQGCGIGPSLLLRRNRSEVRRAWAGVPRAPTPDHKTRLARRSAGHGTRPRLGRLSFPRRFSRDRRKRPKYDEKNGGEPGANPECEHPRDWVAVGAVSSEPVSHVDKRTKYEYENQSVSDYPASEALIDSASSSRRLENTVEKDFRDQTSCTTILSADPRTSLTPRESASHLSRVRRSHARHRFGWLSGPDRVGRKPRSD